MKLLVKELEIGSIVELNETTIVQKNVVYICAGLWIPIGTISEEDKTWFKSSTKPDLKFGDSIVYLGNFKFGVKQLTNKLEEFKKLSDYEQELVLDVYVEVADDKSYMED